MNLIKLLTAESQVNIKIFDLINDFYQILLDNEWIKKYIFWELNLLTNLGYNLDLKSIANKKVVNNQTLYVVETTYEKKVIPNFLIEKNINVNDLNILLDGLKLVGDFINKTILFNKIMIHIIINLIIHSFYGRI